MKRKTLLLLLLVSLLFADHSLAQTFYGTTRFGGATGGGTIFKINGDGTGISNEYSFVIDGLSGSDADFSVMLSAPNGLLYGTTRFGGTTHAGNLFSYDPATDEYAMVFDFNDLVATGSIPIGKLVLFNNVLYGVTSGGGNNYVGTIFAINPNTGGHEKIFNFNDASGINPLGGLTLAPDNKFYGMTSMGGTTNHGTLYQFDPVTKIVTVKHHFDGNTGSFPVRELTVSDNNLLYGMTVLGGANDDGVLFEFNYATGVLSKKFDFEEDIIGSHPIGTLVKSTTTGKYYGTCAGGGDFGDGTLFAYDPANPVNPIQKIMDFEKAVTGTGHVNILARTPDDMMYGATEFGGINNAGVLFEFDPATGTFTKKIDLDGYSTGYWAKSGLTLADNGKFYGLTASGGRGEHGTLFEWDRSTNAFVVKIDFDASSSGIVPENSLIQAPNGKLLGVCTDGGLYGGGVIFEFDPLTKTYTKLFDLDDFVMHGKNPQTGLAAGSNGKYYGVSQIGGTDGSGIIFEYDYDNNIFTKKVDLIRAVHGTGTVGQLLIIGDIAYGVAPYGGAQEFGCLYEYNYITNTFQKYVDFTGNNGKHPFAQLMLASNGKIYGVTTSGGNADNQGVLFEYNPVNHQYNVKAFFDSQRGRTPEGGLTEIDGKLYGVTANGGVNDRGTVYEYDLSSGAITKKVDMDYRTAEPRSGLTRGAGKKLYGYTSYNGDFGIGVIYEYDIVENKVTPKSQFSGPDGANPTWGKLLDVKIPPVITSLSPQHAPVGSTIQITGANFSGNASENIVYFGAVKATVTEATSRELTVIVPGGFSLQPVSVTVNGLTTSSTRPFTITYPNTSLSDSQFVENYSFPTGDYPLGVAVADLDNDGLPEVIVANHSGGSISVYQNLSSPGKLSVNSFTNKIDFPTSADPLGVVAADMDGDGKLDIVVSNTNSEVSVFRNKFAGSSGTAFLASTLFDTRVDFGVDNNSFDVAVGDLDGDGRNDIVTANASGPSISILHNTASPGSITASSFSGRFDLSAEAGIDHVRIWDIDGDNKKDIIVSATAEVISVYKNESTPGSLVAGSFATKVDYSTGTGNVYGFDIADIDGDGTPDLAVSVSSGIIRLMRNTATPGVIDASTFDTPVDLAVLSQPYGSFADVDGDGKPDLVVANSGAGEITVYRNTGNAAVNANTFTSLVTASAGSDAWEVLPADLDSDGKPDFIVLNNAGSTTNKFTVVHNNILSVEPSARPTELSFTNVTHEKMTVSFTAPNTAPDGYLVIMFPAEAGSAFAPVDGVIYTGTLSSGEFVAYAGPNATFTVSDLPPATGYRFKVFPYNGGGSIINYLATDPLTAVHSTLFSKPTVQASNITFASDTPGTVTVSFTNGNGTKRLLVARAAGPVDALPVDGQSYPVGTAVGGQVQLGGGNFIVGAESPSVVTGLTAGTKYYFRVFEFNGSAGTENYFVSEATGNPATFTADATPPTVTLIPVGSTSTGVQVNVSATVVDNDTPISNVTLYFRPISAGGDPQSRTMVKGNGDTYSSFIDASAVTDLGVEYKVRATSGGGTSDDKYTAIVITSPSTGTTIAYDSHGIDQSNYRIISVPLSLNEATVQKVFDELGAPDKTKWRLSHYENSANKELTATDVIEPGKGYWLIIKTAGGAISTGAGKTVTTTSDQNFSIPLTPGWNQIGNPYPFNLLWQDVVDANPGLPVLRTYRSDNPNVAGIYPWGDGTILRAKEGGFINNTGGLSQLKFPVKKNSQAGRVQASPFVSNPLTDPNWQLYLVAKHGDLVNRISGIGMRENASENSDPFDGYSMPRFFDRFLEINHKKKIGDDFMSMDVVPPSDEYTWSFDVATSEAERFITLEWNNEHFGENEMGLILWDEERQFGVDMRLQNTYTFDRTISKAFKVYFGRTDQLAEKIEIKGLFLHSLSPNPAESDVKVAFSVPTTQPVEFEAIDLLGRAIWKASGIFEKGYHEVIWGGETRSGAHGLYIIRLKSGDESLASRIYLK